MQAKSSLSLERWSGADVCPASLCDLKRRGPIWEFADQVQHAHAHSRCRPAELVFLIPSLDRLSISFVRPAYIRNGGLEILSTRADLCR
jgi:hypothetical protein